MSYDPHTLDRRRFLKSTAAGLGAAAVAGSLTRADESPVADLPPDVDPEKLIWRSKSPAMAYRRMGRTNFMVSRIVAGRGGTDPLWRRMLERGMNYFDTGRHYGEHEVELEPFMARFRDRLWVTSKASGVAGWDRVDNEVEQAFRDAMNGFIGERSGDLLRLHNRALEKQRVTGEKPDLRPAGKRMAELYARKLDESLQRMGIDDMDSYFMHGVELPWMFDCVEIWEAYEKAHKAGKVKHFGYSVHEHQKPVLAASAEADQRGPWKIDLIMVGVNPESFDDLRPELDALKRRDVGLIAMKTSGIRNRPVDGREQKFENLVGGRAFNEWERAKLWMLHLTEDVIDACIAAMQNNEEMEKDLELPMVRLEAAARRELRALVKYEMAGACHLCGHCETNCPEQIAVADVMRYNAYLRQYNDRALAAEEFARLGYDPSQRCSNCGQCHDACTDNVPITRILHQLSRELA